MAGAQAQPQPQPEGGGFRRGSSDLLFKPPIRAAS